MIISFPAPKFTFIIVAITFISNQWPPKETLKGIVLNTSATVACFFNYVDQVQELVA